MINKKLEEWLGKKLNQPDQKKAPQQEKPIQRKFKNYPKKRISHQRDDLKIVFLGGLEEVGKNMTVFETRKDIIIVDAGLQFPEVDMYGVDYVIPDISYLEKKKDKIRALIITHGHLDHIGGIPHLCQKINIPLIFGTPLTIELARRQIEDKSRALAKHINLKKIKNTEELRVGDFQLRFFHVNHSIPEGVGVVIETKQNQVIHTGDFKFDLSPHDEKPADFSRIVNLTSGEKNKILLSDSTNSLRAGHTVSEKKIGETLAEFIEKTPGRIIIASFSSLIGRIQKIVEAAQKYGRTVFVSGYSMEKNIEIAKKLGIVKASKDQLLPLNKKAETLPPEKVLIITTGSQGEDLSALARMSLNDHSMIKINSQDSIVLSSSPIMGNERAIFSVVNNLCRLGAKVFTNQHMDVHTSGHGSREDLKLMISLTKPDFFIPIHGEFYMRKAHAEIAEGLGIKSNHILLPDNGSVVSVQSGQVKLVKEKVPHENILVDGKGVGDVGTGILRERKIMADSGIIMIFFKVNGKTKKLVGTPQVLSKGFMFMRESEEIINEVKRKAKSSFESAVESSLKTNEIKNAIQKDITRLSRKKIRREPLITLVMSKV